MLSVLFLDRSRVAESFVFVLAVNLGDVAVRNLDKGELIGAKSSFATIKIELQSQCQ